MKATGSPQRADERDLIPSRIRRHAAEQPNRAILAFLDEDVAIQYSWTFADLDRRARAIAAHLQQRGFAERPVVIAYPSGLEFVAALCGCLYAGAIAVPGCLPRAHGIDERLSAILADSGAPTVLTVRRHVGTIERQVHRLESTCVDIVATDELPERFDDWQPVEWRADQLALLQYTSGSTRTPSGVMIPHAALAANLHSLHEMLGTTADSIGVSWLPLFHDMGLIAGVLEPLWVGYQAYLMPPATFVQSPLRWLRAFTKYRGTIGGGPNFGYQACADAAKATGVSGLDLSSWQMAWDGAEPVRASTVQEFCDAFAPVGFRRESLTPAFGLAEATLMVTANKGTVAPFELVVDEVELRTRCVRPCAESTGRGKRLVSSGRPPLDTEVRIVDAETRIEADARVGEIWVRGPSIGKGYWQKPEETLNTFGARLANGDGPFLRTGDLGFVHAGELFVTGRSKDIVVIRGVNYYPQDLEQTIEASHPALRRDGAAVFAIEDGPGAGLVVAQEIRRHVWRTVNAEEVFVAMRRAVAREHQLALSGIVLLKPFGLPKTSSGKVQRSLCRAALHDRKLPVLDQWWAPPTRIAPIDFTGEPLTQPGVLERQLVDWLQRECALSGITWKTPLMELGIDSLKGVELGNALSAVFNHSFSATLLIENPTVEALANLIREEVLGVTRPEASSPIIAALAKPPLSAEQIASLDLKDLDALLEDSISAVLNSGGRA